MFISYNLVQFGEKLKNARKELGLSQIDIQNSAGVSVDALRRIEKGEVIPRYETLELLSALYKQDLLELLKSSRNNKLLTEYFDELDGLITSYDDKKMKILEDDIRKSFTIDNRSSIVNPNEVIQVLLYIRGANLYYSRISSDHIDAKNILLDALRLTIPNFKINEFRTYNYSYIELRILLFLSILIAQNNEVILSNEILYFILNRLQNSSTSKYLTHLIIKIYANLSYNYHLLDNHAKVIEICDEGISYCLHQETTHVLFLLFYRKGIAEYLLKQETYITTLHSSFFLLTITNTQSLLDVYLEATKQMYNIDIDISTSK
jgi:transcriptional regulator with XRE-family HTH domain